jgi:hypothetical protein
MIAPEITTEDQRTLVRTLGIDHTPEGDDVTMRELSGAVELRPDSEFDSMGSSIRRDLSGRLDASLLAASREELTAGIERLPAVRDAGVPDEPEGLYGPVAEPGWRAYDHLVDAGFFESVEERLPRFTPEHIAHTARELILADPLQSDFDAVGFDDRERIALLMRVVNNNTRLARWVPTREIPDDEVEFDVSYVPPLHQRAVGGALLWIRDLDRHLWQNEVLITEGILDDAVWNVKAMLGGVYAVTAAAHDIAADGTLTDGQLTAALTAGAAIAIIGQEDLMNEAYYITDDMRAPSEVR